MPDIQARPSLLEVQRRSALTVEQVLAGRSLTESLTRVLDRPPAVEAHTRATVQDIAYGVLRRYGLLDAVLGLLLRKPAGDARLRALLLAALYQLLETHAAPHAVVDHAVDAAAQLGYRSAGGLVNAVLRRFLRERDALVAEARLGEPARYNHPQWWIDRLRAEQPDHWERLLQAADEHAPMTLRINRRRTDMTAYLAQLERAGMAVEWQHDEAIALLRAVPVERLPGFAEGLVSVQDASAQYAAHLLDVHDGMRVLDACAAPGGKSAHLLELAAVDLLALDVDEARLGRVRSTLQRLRLTAAVACADGARPSEWWDGKPFDRVLIDAPCSASGIARRHPDIKWLRRPGDPEHLATAQAALLDGAWQVLGQGGTLVYATCSVFRAENREQVAAFVARHPDAVERPLGDCCPGACDGQILPDRYHDGFFYAVLKKC